MAKNERQTVTISYSGNKLDATRRYMRKKKLDLEDEIREKIEGMYQKHVPAQVRTYIEENEAEAEEPGGGEK
jgi:hypothetical protein